MSTTLSLADHLLSHGRKLHSLGRKQDALKALRKLNSFRDLPGPVLHEGRLQLAQICIGNGDYAEARKHLRVALACDPDASHALYAMAQAYDLADDADRYKALKYYRLAIQADDQQAKWHADFGLLAIEYGEDDEGLDALRKAVDLDNEDAELLSCLVQTLVELDREEEAMPLVQAARFQHPGDARFTKVWSDLQFQVLRKSQATRYTSTQPKSRENDMVLSFVARLAQDPMTASCKTIRHDGPSQPRPPHAPRLRVFSGKKHA